MSGAKKWYFSKTLWGAIIVIVSSVLKMFGYTMSEVDGEIFVDSLITSIQVVSEFIGLALVIIGRITATKVVK